MIQAFYFKIFYKLPQQCISLLVLNPFAVTSNGNGANGQVILYHPDAHDIVPHQLFEQPCKLVFLYADQREELASLAWSWARSDGACSWSSLRIWEAESSVSSGPTYSLFICTKFLYWIIICLISSRAALAEELAVLRQVDEFTSKGVSPPRGKNGYTR